MAPRNYRMKRRGEAAEQTRQRIVQATYELHAERGIAATSVRDIAERAGVAVGSVYHHFPSYDDIIAACGQHTLAITQPPTASVLDGKRDAAERLQALVAALFDYYRRFPGYQKARADRDRFERLDAFLRVDEANRLALLLAAMAPAKLSTRKRAMALAVLDFMAYRQLIDGGLRHADAIAETSALLQLYLATDSRPATRPARTRSTRS